MLLNNNATYAIASPTSMGVRLTPTGRQPVHTSSTFDMQCTSAESNVLNVAASLGLRTLALTCFVKGSPIAAFIKSELRRRNIQYIGPEIDQGGPWGYRHQFNIADAGFGARGPIVQNDRAGEVGKLLDVAHFDLDELFLKGVKILHISGLICALSEQTGKFCLELAKAAKAHGAAVSFDLNYRASFWKDRGDLAGVFHELASNADILIGNEEDFQLALGVKGPESGGKDIADKLDGFKSMISDIRADYPGAQVIATTLRQVISANEHLWGAVVSSGGEIYTAEPRSIPVLDRIGGGDGFVGGLLYGIAKGYDIQDCMRFGWATGALAVTMTTDYCTPVSEGQVLSIWEGNARVKR